jgi:hypothetical protein
MAVNQVSLFFYPPRWSQRLTVVDPTALTDDGTPVQIASAVPSESADEPPVAVAAVAAWLRDQGFTPVAWGRAFERGRVRSMFGPEREIIVHVNGDAAEVTDLYCRFTLPVRISPALNEWAGFAAEMCARFDLRLGADGVAPCSAIEFTAAVRGHRFFQEFAMRFGWRA